MRPPRHPLLLPLLLAAATAIGGGAAPAPAAGNAYYAITSPAMLASPEWPAAYRNYSLFVVFDSITPANLTRMRRDIPHARFLIYHAYASVVTSGGRCSGCAGAACSHPDRPPPAFFQKEWAITDLRTKQPMCLGGWWPPTQRTNPQGYIPMRASADGMLRYIRQELWEGRGWDGVYFDNLFTSFPPEYRALIANTTDQFDSAQLAPNPTHPTPPRPVGTSACSRRRRAAGHLRRAGRAVGGVALLLHRRRSAHDRAGQDLHRQHRPAARTPPVHCHVSKRRAQHDDPR